MKMMNFKRNESDKYQSYGKAFDKLDDIKQPWKALGDSHYTGNI